MENSMEELLGQILKEPKAVIALCAVIISLVSLILSIITAFQNRKNNRLSVRLIAYILPNDYEDNISVILQNKGTGPLICDHIEFVRNSKERKPFLIDFMPILEDGYYWKTFSKASKIVLRPSEEKILLCFEGDTSDPGFIKQRNLIREALKEIEIKAEYTSIFKEWIPFKLTYKLTWFGRVKG